MGLIKKTTVPKIEPVPTVDFASDQGTEEHPSLGAQGLIKKTEETLLDTTSQFSPVVEKVSEAYAVAAKKLVAKTSDSWADGQREGNRRNISATLTAAIVGIQGLKKEEAWETFKFFHGKMTELDQ